MNSTANDRSRPILIFGNGHEDGLVRLKATLVKTGIFNFVTGRLVDGDAGDGDSLARAALIIVSSATTSPEACDRISHAARRHSIPLLLLS